MSFLARPGGVCLLALPVMLAATAVEPGTLWGAPTWGGWSLVTHLVFFLSGFVPVANEGLEEQIQSLRWILLAAGGIVVTALVAVTLSPGEPVFGTGEYVLVGVLSSLDTWCWILAIWGFARKHLSFGTPALWYANEGVLPFYILHQPVLLCVGYFVVQWAIPDILKWAVISAASLTIVVVAVYVWLVRRNNVLRVLCGMKKAGAGVVGAVSFSTTPPA